AQATLALLRELTGVAEKMEQNLLEPNGVCGECAIVLLCSDNEGFLVLVGELSRRADNLVDEPRQINRLEIEVELAGFDLREVEYIVDQGQGGGSRGIHTAQRFRRLFP